MELHCCIRKSQRACFFFPLLLHLCTTAFVFHSISRSPVHFSWFTTISVSLWADVNSFLQSWQATFSLQKLPAVKSILQADEEWAVRKYMCLWQWTGSWRMHNQHQVYCPLCCVAAPSFVLKGQQSWALSTLTALPFICMYRALALSLSRNVSLYLSLTHKYTPFCT